MLNKKIKNFCYLFLLLFSLGCTNNNIINNFSYKGLGVFYYFEIDSGSYYDMIFIPFHFKVTIDNPEELTMQMILQNKENIIFERGLGLVHLVMKIFLIKYF